MCDLNTSTDYHEVHNLYKVALKNTKTGDYYSPATGVKYLNNGYQSITKTREQKRISSYFRDDLFSISFFKDSMIGKTAAFKSYNEANSLRAGILRDLTRDEYEKRIENNLYKVVILKVSLRDEVFVGTYIDYNDIYAGKEMNIVEETRMEY